MIFFLLLLLIIYFYYKNTIFEKFKNNNIENINITISNQEPYYNPFDYGYYFPYNNMWYNNLYY